MPSTIDPRTPVIIGAGQFANHDDESGLDPLALIAARRAEADAGAPGALGEVDTVAVVPIVSWRYSDPSVMLSPLIGAAPRLTMYPTIGGNTPQMLMNRVGEQIAAATTDLALVCGGEAYRTRMRARRAGGDLGWERQDLAAVAPGWTDGASFDMGHPLELSRGILMPTQAYPLFENALRHACGRTAAEQTARIAEMWSRFSAVAAGNPHAWDRTAYSPAEIGEVTAENRIVGFPYTKRMVSNPDVDMSSALLVCSAERAAALGVARDRWVFLHSGTDGKEGYLSVRPSFTSSAAIRFAGAAALDLAGCSIDEVAHLDIYSCFPSAVQIACAELGIDTSRQLTVYGGLCFAGGPWNNPVGHALATMVDVLRNDPGEFGLVTANGGNIQKHSFGVYSTDPPEHGFRTANPQFAIDTDRGPEVADESFAGPVTIETWTVMHERDGTAARAHAAVRTDDGLRTWGVTSDADVMALMEVDDVVGLRGSVDTDGELRLG